MNQGKEPVPLPGEQVRLEAPDATRTDQP
jgi:hypothetical protein